MTQRNDFYVYLLIDSDFKIRYVGEGTGNRSTHNYGRSEEYKQLVVEGAKTYIVCRFLTKAEAREKEQFLIEKLIKTGHLLNKRINNDNIVNDLSYDEASKIFEISNLSPSGLVWKKKTSKVTVAGKTAGNLDPSGYWRVQYKGMRYRVHRIIWLLHNKIKIPDGLVINHIDSNPSNNNLNNLEAITQKENSIKRKQINPSPATRKILKVPSKIYSQVKYCNKTKRYRAFVRNMGILYTKSFNVSKYGNTRAYELADSWRIFKVKELEACLVPN